jgi:hypothetical protein
LVFLVVGHGFYAESLAHFAIRPHPQIITATHALATLANEKDWMHGEKPLKRPCCRTFRPTYPATG